MEKPKGRPRLYTDEERKEKARAYRRAYRAKKIAERGPVQQGRPRKYEGTAKERAAASRKARYEANKDANREAYNAWAREYQRKRRAERGDELRALERERYRKNNPPKPPKPKQTAEERKAVVRAYREKNRERINANARERYRKNNPNMRKPGPRKTQKEIWDAWYENNKKRHIALNNPRFNYRRLKSKLLDRVLVRIYEECPEGYHTDHIDPLNGDDRSGLHTPWNLQYLLPEENSIVKGNKIGYIAESAISIDWETMLEEEKKMLP